MDHPRMASKTGLSSGTASSLGVFEVPSKKYGALDDGLVGLGAKGERRYGEKEGGAPTFRRAYSLNAIGGSDW